MNYQQVLVLLTAKFSGVRKDALEVLARSLALQCTSEDEAKTLVDKVTDAQVTEFAKGYRSSVDKEVSDSNKAFEANLRKKLEADKTTTQGKEGGNEGGGNSQDDIDKRIAEAVAKAVQPYQERVQKFEQEGVEKARLQTLQDKLAKCKDNTFREQTLKDFKRMRFDNEEAFNEYLTEKTADIELANQHSANTRLRDGGGAPTLGGKTDGVISQGVQEFTKSNSTETNFTGKQV